VLTIYFEPAWLTARLTRYLSLLPWLVNLGILAAGLVLRPQFVVGYLAFLGGLIIAGIVLGALFWISCFACLAVAALLSPLQELGAGIGCVVVFPLLFFGGLFLAGCKLFPLIESWWARW
jgi:hypothetical protein